MRLPYLCPVFVVTAFLIDLGMNYYLVFLHHKPTKREIFSSLKRDCGLEDSMILIINTDVDANESAIPVASEEPREEAIRQHSERLHARLCTNSLKEIIMKGDGNCLYRSLSHQLQGARNTRHPTNLI